MAQFLFFSRFRWQIGQSLLALLLLTGSTVTHADRLPEKLRFKHLDVSSTDYLGEIITLFQDSYGFVWVGGKNGLARYDGYEFKVFRHAAEDKQSLSNDTIWAIVEDDRADLWIATDGGLNLYSRETQQFTHFLHDPQDPHSLHDNRLLSLALEDNTLWIGSDGGLNALDLSTRTFSRFPSRAAHADLAGEYVMGIGFGNTPYTQHNLYLATGYGFKIWNRQADTVTVFDGSGENDQNLPSQTIRSLFVNSEGDIWLGTQRGLSQYLIGENRFVDFLPPENRSANIAAIWKLHEDRYGDLWAASDGEGLMRVKRGERQLIAYKENDFDPHSNSTNAVRTIYEDKEEDLWLGGYPSNLEVIQRYHSAFQSFYNNSNDNRSINAKGVMAFLEEENGDIWVATDTGGLNYYDRNTRTYTFFFHDEKNPQSISSNGVLTLAKDRRGYLWTGNWNGGANRFDPRKQTFVRYSAQSGDPHSLQSVHVWTIFRDSLDQIWLGQLGGGLSQYVEETDSFVTYDFSSDHPRSLPDNHVWSIAEDAHQNLWVGTQDGLVKLPLSEHDPDHVLNPEIDHHRFTRYSHDPNNTRSLSHNWASALFSDRDGQLWVGTHGGGLNLYDRETNSFARITQNDGLPSNVIVSIEQDEQGLIWIGTDKGLASYNQSSGKINIYTVASGIQANLFNFGAALKTYNGDLLFGGVSGYTRFTPSELQQNARIPPVIFTDVRIHNEAVPIGDGPLKNSIVMADTLLLDHTHKVFSLDFASLNYRFAKENRFTYKLEGFDRDWSPVSSLRTATYTNLDPGNYLMRVRGSNNEGVWNQDGASLLISVAPPPWRTWWAYSLYTLLIGGLLIWYVYTQRRIIQFKDMMVKNLQEVDQLKDEFMATTSHELRTPLFGIVGLAENMVLESQDKLTTKERYTLDMIIASGKRLSSQVDDILDFAKLKNKTVKINPTCFDLQHTGDMVIGLSKPLLTNKNVHISNRVPADTPDVYADENRLQQVLHNLIVNAIRNTQQGEITLLAEYDEQDVTIIVKDTGCGIPEDKYDQLFRPFTQLGSGERKGHGGAGLGLSICKNLVQLMGGKIWIESEVGVGTEFKFTLPLSHHCNINRSKASDTKTPTSQIRIEKIPPIEYGKIHILVVDDETINRMVLTGYLNASEVNGLPLKITEAAGGVEALSKFSQGNLFDVVLLDVMMPDLSGYDVCKVIRKTHPVEELPIIFISANVQESDVQTAYDVGGNAYLPKPIDRNQLIECIQTHLNPPTPSPDAS